MKTTTKLKANLKLRTTSKIKTTSKPKAISKMMMTSKMKTTSFLRLCPARAYTTLAVLVISTLGRAQFLIKIHDVFCIKLKLFFFTFVYDSGLKKPNILAF